MIQRSWVTLEKLERMVREGDWPRAKIALRRLANLPFRTIPIITLARLAREINCPMLGIELLHSLPFSPSFAAPFSSSEENMEYAACLIEVGEVEQALAILAPSKTPKAEYFRGKAYLGQWRNEEAQTIFESLLNGGGNSDSFSRAENLEIKLLLSKSFLRERSLEHAESLLSGILHDPEIDHFPLVRAQVWEHLAFAAMLKADWQRVTKCLDEGTRALGQQYSIHSLGIRKLRTALQLIATQNMDDIAHEETSMVAEAKAKGYWEWLRDWDFIKAIVLEDVKIGLKLFWGTPHVGYRAMLLREIPSLREHTRAPATFSFSAISPPSAQTPVLDLTGTMTSAAFSLHPESMINRFLTALTYDLYRPQRLIALFQLLFPGERFHSRTSAVRIRANLHRTREWLTQNQCPLAIIYKKGAYSLNPTGAISIRQFDSLTRSSIDRNYAYLKAQLEDLGQDFGAAQAAKHLGMTRRSLSRLLSNAVAQGLLTRKGAGQYVRYLWRDPGHTENTSQKYET